LILIARIMSKDGTDWATSWLMRSHAARFVPALLVWPVWLYVMSVKELLVPTFVTYWPMVYTMAAGSLIAGSTPLGGGAIAFPVTVLFIGFTPLQGRDYTVMIQSVGMPAASYLLIFQRREQLHLPLILLFTVCGTPGVLVGLWLGLQPYTINVAYTVLVFEFAIVLFYSKALAPLSTRSAVPEDAAAPADHLALRRAAAVILAVPTAFVGGFFTASVGMGSDIMLYCYGLYAWNWLDPASARTDVSHTASSVVVMAVLSVVTAAVRATTQGMESVHECWAATAWLVVLGAPLGSLLLTPARMTLTVTFTLSTSRLPLAHVGTYPE